MKQLSQRKYASIIGVSRWQVGKAIRNGVIKKGYDKRTKKIKVRMANKEWGNAAIEESRAKLSHFQCLPNDKINDALKSAFINYCNSWESLLNVIEQRLKAIDFNRKDP